MKLKNLVCVSLLAAGLSAGGGAALAAGAAGQVTDFQFSFEGIMGKYDQAQLQRGLQVYTEVCAACHGLELVAFRTLADPGGPTLSDDAMRAYAASWEIYDPELDDWRPAKPTDHFPASNDPNAPDLSLIAKARAGFHGPYGLGINQLFKGMGGAEYIASYLTGYTDEIKEEAGAVLYENKAYPTNWVQMAPVLYGDDVYFEDGAPTDAVAIAKDVSAFLMWAAEPKMMARKQAGFISVMFLTVLTVLLYLTNKQLWAGVKGKRRA